MFRMILVLLMLAGGGHADDRPSIAVFGGVLTDNDWQEVLWPPNVDFQEPGLVGFALSRPVGSVFEVEGQIVRHFGEQEVWEANAIVTARLDVGRGPLDSLAFGVGPSITDVEPEFEIERDGGAQRFNIYWMAEAAFDGPGEAEIITRIHHRSNAFGLTGEFNGSNALVVGLRRRF